MITREQVISCINNFLDLRYKVDIIRTYLIDKGIDEFKIEIFLQMCRDKNIELNEKWELKKLKFPPNNLFDILATYILNIQKEKFNLLFLYDKKGNFINVF